MLRKYIFLILLLSFLQIFLACQTNPGTGGQLTKDNQPTEKIAGNAEITSMSDLGSIIDFSLTDQNKKTLTLADLKGKVWVADFFFTSCQGACPIMNSRMSKLEKSLASSGLHLLSISVDPAVDTPEVLAKYAKNFNATDQWKFVTGEKAKIIELSVKGFHLSADEEPTSHSQRLVLIDRNSHIRGYYHVDREDEMKLLEKNAKDLLSATK